MDDLKDSSVLFVDDEADILDVLKKEFRSTIGEIHLATSAQDAKAIVSNNDVDLAVLDLKMPDTDGLSLYEELKKINPSLRCVFLSAYGDKQNIQKALQLGAENFIDKPFESKNLKLAVLRGVEKSRHERLLKEVLELFILHYTELDVTKFDTLPLGEKEKTIRAALGLAKVQILKRNREKLGTKGHK
jgi:DNA-binding NtrC family response regulator